jgi:ATP-dependent Clp protease adapter protein ClpS
MRERKKYEILFLSENKTFMLFLIYLFIYLLSMDIDRW